MRILIPMVLLLTSAAAAVGQTPAPHQLRLDVSAGGHEQISFRIETQGRGRLEASGAALTVRGELDSQVVELRTPAILTISAEPGLRVRLVSTDGSDLVVLPESVASESQTVVDLRGEWVGLSWTSDGKRVSLTAAHMTSRARRQ